MSDINAIANITNLNMKDVEGLDLDVLMMLIQVNRVKQIDAALKNQMTGVEARNQQIAKINQAMSAINELVAAYPANAGGTAQLNGNVGVGADGNFKVTRLNQIDSALTSCGYDKTKWDATTKDDLNVALNKLKGSLEQLNNNQQLDMLKLQTLMNKRNEATDTASNFVKKMADSRSSIIGNMR